MSRYAGKISESSHEEDSFISSTKIWFNGEFIHSKDTDTNIISFSVNSKDHHSLKKNDKLLLIWGLMGDLASIESMRHDELSTLGNKVVSSYPECLVLQQNQSEVKITRGIYSMCPCYYTIKDQSLFFGSERKFLWNLSTGSIGSLQPGESISFSKSGFDKMTHISREIPQIDTSTTYEGTVQVLAKLLTKSFQRISDYRSIGVLLSGGVDSSLAALLSKIQSNDVTAYSTSSDRARDNKASKTAAEIIGIEHETIRLTSEIVWNVLPEVIYAIETPNRLDVEIAIPFFLAAKRAAKSDISLLVSGQGPDELFAGYAKHERLVKKEGYSKLPEQLWSEVSITHEANIERDQKAIWYHNLDSFFPFLYPPFIDEALKIRPEWKITQDAEPPRKRIFRDLAKHMGLCETLCSRPKKATQFSSGTNKLLLQAIKSKSEKSLTNRQVRENFHLILELIANKVGIPITVNTSELEDKEWILPIIDQVEFNHQQ